MCILSSVKRREIDYSSLPGHEMALRLGDEEAGTFQSSALQQSRLGIDAGWAGLGWADADFHRGIHHRIQRKICRCVCLAARL